MPSFLVAYMLLWMGFCALAGAILLADRKRILPELAGSFGLLFVPWKLVVFVPAFLFVSFAGRFTNDETWDIAMGSGIATLTFLTAAWSISTCYLAAFAKAARSPFDYCRRILAFFKQLVLRRLPPLA